MNKCHVNLKHWVHFECALYELIQIGTHESNLSLFLICSLCMFLFAILCPPPKIHTLCVVNIIPALYATGNYSLEYLTFLLSILISKS